MCMGVDPISSPPGALKWEKIATSIYIIYRRNINFIYISSTNDGANVRTFFRS